MDTYEDYNQGALLNNRYKKVEDISEGSYGLVSLAKDTLAKSNSSNLVAVKFIYPVDYNTSKSRIISDDATYSSSSATSSSRISADSTSSSRVSSTSDNKNIKGKKVAESKSAVLRTLRDEAFKEIRIHDILGIHPNIVSLYDHFDSCLVLEYCSRGDLYEAIQNGNGPTTSQDIKDVFHQILSGLEYCHSRGVYHRDLKPENILIAEDWSIKLCDWGLATTSRIVTDKSEFEIGSERYMAPELFDHNIESYDACKVDIWSVGIILLTVVFHKNPFQVANTTDKRFLQFVSNREALFDFFSSMSYDMFLILRYSLNIDPNNRDLSNLKYELDRIKYFTIDEENWGSEYDEEDKEDYEFEFEDDDDMNTDGEAFFKPLCGLNLSPIRVSIMERIEGANLKSLEPVKTPINATAMMTGSNSPTSSSFNASEEMKQNPEPETELATIPPISVQSPSLQKIPQSSESVPQKKPVDISSTKEIINAPGTTSSIKTSSTASTADHVAFADISVEAPSEEPSAKFFKVVLDKELINSTPTTSEGEGQASVSKSSANNLDGVSVPPHNRRADALLSDTTRLRPIPIGGVHAKFRNTRKPFGVASYNAQANAGSRIVGATVPPSSAGSYSRFNREDFFTPKSVASLYIDKYHGFKQNGQSEWKPAPRVGNGNGNGYQSRNRHNWKKNKSYNNNHSHHSNGHSHNHNHSHNHHYGSGRQGNSNNVNGGGNSYGYNSGKNKNRQYSKQNGTLGTATGTASSSQFKRKSITSVNGGNSLPTIGFAGHHGQSPSVAAVGTHANNKARKNSLPIVQSPANAIASNTSSLATSTGRYIPPFLRSPNYAKSPNIGPLTETIDDLSLDDEVFHLEEDFEDSTTHGMNTNVHPGSGMGPHGSATLTGNEPHYPMSFNSNQKRMAYKSPLYSAMTIDYTSSANSSQRSGTSIGKTLHPPLSANGTTNEINRRYSSGLAQLNGSGTSQQQQQHLQDQHELHTSRPVEVGPGSIHTIDGTACGSAANSTGKYVPPFRRGSHSGAVAASITSAINGELNNGYSSLNSSISSLPLYPFEVGGNSRSKVPMRNSETTPLSSSLMGGRSGPSSQPHGNIHLHQSQHLSYSPSPQHGHTRSQGQTQSQSHSQPPPVSPLQPSRRHNGMEVVDSQGIFGKEFEWGAREKRDWSDYND
ncbi:uncharacterized protein KQ657_003853 [Scheffersomyces spartinae]|uniref:non-specific serine/threonine protein kinase n=1 Tax=Scheffersomyces spartinae TaxID=45513 RepID=A0A9P7VCR7_9ASCO|nr:uncharacterized protein KQ657_003853 [Scheffersomyces spartinae]KAG7195325.1 hypothetical protein KQ657_003853 [Scheffersomyces spartinae]